MRKWQRHVKSLHFHPLDMLIFSREHKTSYLDTFLSAKVPQSKLVFTCSITNLTSFMLNLYPRYPQSIALRLTFSTFIHRHTKNYFEILKKIPFQLRGNFPIWCSIPITCNRKFKILATRMAFAAWVTVHLIRQKWWLSAWWLDWNNNTKSISRLGKIRGSLATIQMHVEWYHIMFSPWER